VASGTFARDRQGGHPRPRPRSPGSGPGRGFLPACAV